MKKLFDAVNKGDIDTVKKVIEKYPDTINSIEKGWRKRDEGLRPLRVAIKNCHYDIVRFLIEAGADVNDYTPKDGWYISNQAVYTAIVHCIPRYKLYVGTYEDSFEILKLLIDNQMDINIHEKGKGNCFFTGIWSSHEIMHSCVNLYESDLPDKLVWDPEFDVRIVYDRFKEIFSLLLNHGVNTDIPEKWKNVNSGSKELDKIQMEWNGILIKWMNNILKLCKEDV